jgi:N-acetylglucosamine kinase-like BadF-type ATPase
MKLRKKSHNLYLGVDGGGTKTLAVLIDEEKNVVGQGISGVSNPLRVGIEKATANIFTAIDIAADNARRSRGDIVAAQFGLAGVRRADLREVIAKSGKARLKIKLVSVVTDAEIALYGVAIGKESLVVIAGTGSICYGRNASGDVAVAGGWGPLAGDEGGGAGIARRALQAIAKASDGRGKATSLSEIALDYFKANSAEDLTVAIYAPNVDNARIAGFARHVTDEAKAGDAVSIDIIREAANELALASKAVIQKLKLQRKTFPIGYVGGVWKVGEILSVPFLEKVREIAPKCYISEPKLEPATAAAHMAFETYRK